MISGHVTQREVQILSLLSFGPSIKINNLYLSKPVLLFKVKAAPSFGEIGVTSVQPQA